MSKYTPATFQPTVRPDWAGILSYLSDKEKGEILVALFKYPSVECESAFWKETIKPDLDLQYQTFIKSCEAKSRGVRNRWDKISITDVEDKDKISITYDIDTEREREDEGGSEKEKESETTPQTPVKGSFVPPTEEEVLEYETPEEKIFYRQGYNAGCQDRKRRNVSTNEIGSNVSNVDSYDSTITITNTNTIVDTNAIANANVDNKRGVGEKEKGKFVPPTLEEILAYAKERCDLPDVMGGFQCSKDMVIEFYNHYDRQGWMLGNGIHMTKWQSALKKWCGDNIKKLSQ